MGRWSSDRRGPAARSWPSAEIPATLGGLARHNIANALAAAAAARGLGFTPAQVAAGLNDVRLSAGQLPGRLNLYVARRSSW